MLSENLKIARKSKKLRQEDVANVLNVKRQTYSAYERGISLPDPITLKKLAELYEVDIDSLLEDNYSDINIQNSSENIAFNIRQLREKNGVTQTYVANYLGITRQGYNHYETGKRTPPLYILDKLCDLFSVDMNTLTLNSSENSTLNVFGKRLSLLREAKNITEADICSELDLEESTYIKYEQGKIQPSFDILQKLSDYFDVSTDYLLGLSELERHCDEETPKETNYISIMGSSGTNMKIPVPEDKIERFKALIKAGLPDMLNDDRYKDL